MIKFLAKLHPLRKSCPILFSIFILFNCSYVLASETLILMQVGDVKVLAIPGVARVAVGDGKILKAVSTEENEVIVFSQNLVLVPCTLGQLTAIYIVMQLK